MTLLEPDFEETLRRYLLDTLEEGPRLQLEERLVTDPDAFEALGVIEDELTEEYLEGTLVGAEKLGFERHSSSSPQRQRAPGFFSALKARASISATEQPRVSRWSPAAWFGPVPLQPAWLGAAAALLVASLAANAWLALRQDSPQVQIAQMRAEPTEPETAAPSTSAKGPLTSQLAELTATQRELETQLETERQQRMQAETLVQKLERAARRPATSVPTFTLAAGLLRGGGSLARVVVPADVDVVRLLLDLPSDEYPLYRAALHDVDGDEIWALSRLGAEGAPGERAVVLVLPAWLLPRGDYQMNLSGLTEGGEPETLATYSFRVTHP
jgi:hypothetical protein